MDAKEELGDTYYDHAKDAQADALDKEAEAYEESMNRYIETLRTTLDEAKLNMDLFMEQVTAAVMLNADTIVTKYDETGLLISEDLTTPWIKAAEAMQGYEVDGLAIMNQWTTQDGYFGKFQTNATEQLTSPWSAGTDALIAFKDSVEIQMNNIVEIVRSNVAEANAAMAGLYSGIYDTGTKPPSTGGNGGNGNKNNSGATYNYSDDVKTLQEILNVLGYAVDKDGYWGPNTQSAVLKMERMLVNEGYLSDNHISSDDGYYDSATAGALKKFLTDQSSGKYGGSSTTNIGKYAKNVPGALFYPGATGWLPTFAKGTLGTTKDEFAITDESWIGEEITLAAGKNGQLQYLKKGSAVMPADISANLVEWGKLNPNTMNIGGGANLNMISNAVNKPEFKLTFDALVKAEKITEDTLPEVKKFVQTEINRLVKQMNYALRGQGAH